ncbi:MAG: C/D box methylation guide ribonucleoprotein complex aNOP56 subunit, partial [Ignisphaera sp.]
MNKRIFIADTVIGSFAVDENGNIVEKAVYPKDIGATIEELLVISEGKINNTLSQLIESLKTKLGLEDYVLVREDPDIASELSHKGLKCEDSIEPKPNEV